MKEIIVFCEWDSNDINAWSNVPYFLTKGLEENGVIVHRECFGVGTSNKLEVRFFSVLLWIIGRIRTISGNDCLTLRGTNIWRKMVIRKLKKAEQKYPDAEGNLIISLNISGKDVLKKKVCMFGDWTCDYEILKHKSRTPGYFERKVIKIQDNEIRKADYVLTMNPDAAEYLRSKYNRPIMYFGNVINSKLQNLNMDFIKKLKCKSRRILFIGRKNYIKGAEELCRAIKQYNTMYSESIRLDLIGMKAEDSEAFIDKDITCYGYLDKGDSIQSETYYSCIYNAKIIVNVTVGWNGLSSLLEAMYYCTPIMVRANDTLTACFGKDSKAICYVQGENEILDNIKTILDLNAMDYWDMCEQAHKLVEKSTWSNYAREIINMFDSQIQTETL